MSEETRAGARLGAASVRVHTFFIVVAVSVFLFSPVVSAWSWGGVELDSDTPWYEGIVSAFHTCNEDLDRFELLGTKEIDANHSAVAVRGTCRDAEKRWEQFGIFIVSNGTEHAVMVVDTFGTKALFDYEVTLEEATRDYVTIAAGREIAGGSKLGRRTRYFFDLEARKVLRAIEHRGVRVSSIFEFGDKLLFIGGDRNLSVIAVLESRLDFKELGSWEVVDQIGGQEIPAIDSLAAKGETLALKGDSVVFFLSRDDWIRTEDTDLLSEPHDSLETLPVERFGHWIPISSIQTSVASAVEPGAPVDSFDVSRQGVYDIVRDTLYEFPRHDFEQLQRYRLWYADRRDLESRLTICDMIGPYQFVGRKVWFGTTFPDAEGATGVGAIGFFDLNERNYHMHYPKDLADWSTSAIWVHDKYAWTGLVNRSEYNRFPGGLLRYDVKSGEAKKYDIDAMVHRICGLGDDVFLGTSDGVYIISGEEITYLGFDFDIEGRYHLFLRRQ